MAAYVGGDRHAFERLFHLLAPRVHGFFVRRFSDTAIADDLVQITFMKVHRARHDYRVGAAVRPWIFTIAARVRVDELRRRGRRPEADAEPSQLERTADGAPSSADHLEQAELSAQVRGALAQLPESQRTVIHLHRYEGFTFEEIAGMLGTTEGAVKLRAFRAYEQLRKTLAPLVGASAKSPAAAAPSAERSR